MGSLAGAAPALGSASSHQRAFPRAECVLGWTVTMVMENVLPSLPGNLGHLHK